MFIVTNDPINTKWNDPSIKGKILNGEYHGGKHRIRLLDDDGIVYFYLQSDIDYNTGRFTTGPHIGKTAKTSTMFYPLDTLGAGYGCTHLQYKDLDGNYKTL